MRYFDACAATRVFSVRPLAQYHYVADGIIAVVKTQLGFFLAAYNARVYGGCYGATANTKSGVVRNYFEESKANFQRQLPALKGILVGCCDYRDLRFPLHEKALIYCDPPYADTVGYSEKFDTAAFWEWCRRQSLAGHVVVVSEYAAPDDFVCIWERETTIHLNNRGKTHRQEKLFTYGGINQWQKYTK